MRSCPARRARQRHMRTRPPDARDAASASLKRTAVEDCVVGRSTSRTLRFTDLTSAESTLGDSHSQTTAAAALALTVAGSFALWEDSKRPAHRLLARYCDGQT